MEIKNIMKMYIQVLRFELKYNFVFKNKMILDKLLILKVYYFNKQFEFETCKLLFVVDENIPMNKFKTYYFQDEEEIRNWLKLSTYQKILIWISDTFHKKVRLS